METQYKKTLILYIITNIILIIVIGVALLLFQNMQKRITEVRNVRERIASIDIYRSIYGKEVEKVESINKSLLVLDQEVVTESTIPLVLSNIETIAKEAMIDGEISSAQIVAPKGKSPYVSIDVKAKGSRENLILFMKKIEQSKSESNVESFSLQKGVVDEASGQKAPEWNLATTIFVLSYR